MKRFFAIIIFILLTVCVFGNDMPLCLIYPGELLGEATEEDQKLVIDTLKTYLNKSDKVESIVYSVEMPSVLLLVKEEKLTAEETSLSASIDDKIKVGKTLGYNFVFLPEINRDTQVFEINLNVYDLQKNTMASYGATTRSNGKSFIADVNSAMSGITIQVLKDIFNETPTFNSKKDEENRKEEQIDLTELSAKDLVKLGDSELKKENITQAILIYTKAIDKDPDNPELRLKLADAYFKKQMYKDALDQYYNAINMGYRGEDTYKLKQKYESRVRADDYVKPVEEIKQEIAQKKDDVVLAPPKLTSPASEFNKQIESALVIADNLWKSGKTAEALKAYTEIIQKYPFDYRAYERMCIVYANDTRFSDSAGVLRVLQDRKIDYSNVAVVGRINTLSAIISAYYMKMIDDLKVVKEYAITNEGNQDLLVELKIKSDKIYDSLELINTMGRQSNSYLVTNLRLTGNLINSAISSLMDYVEVGDLDAVNSADNFLNQAEIRTKQIKY